MRAIILAAVLAFGLASGAGAKPCRDANGKFVKCPAAAAVAAPARATTPAPAATTRPAAKTYSKTDAKSDAAADVRAEGMPSSSKAPVCRTGKPCGKSCIAKDKVCRKD